MDRQTPFEELKHRIERMWVKGDGQVDGLKQVERNDVKRGRKRRRSRCRKDRRIENGKKKTKEASLYRSKER